VTLALVGIAVAYAVVAACLLRFDLNRLLFPTVPLQSAPNAFTEAFRLAGHDGAAMVVRRFDRAESPARLGCVVYFPGHEGAIVSTIVATCGRTRTAVAGRSLGAMIAAYASADTSPAGLVLESTAPSLSAGIRGTLRQHWLLRPLVLLPIGRILAHDFSLAEALPPRLHVVIFQGSADTRTPIGDLSIEAAQSPIVVIDGGTHTDMLERAKPAMIATMLDMIRGSQEAAAIGGADD